MSWRLDDIALDVTEGILEFANALAERRPDLWKALGSEEQKHDHQNEQYLGEAQVLKHAVS
jgi:hypothetical protein